MSILKLFVCFLSVLVIVNSSAESISSPAAGNEKSCVLKTGWYKTDDNDAYSINMYYSSACDRSQPTEFSYLYSEGGLYFKYQFTADAVATGICFNGNYPQSCNSPALKVIDNKQLSYGGYKYRWTEAAHTPAGATYSVAASGQNNQEGYFRPFCFTTAKSLALENAKAAFGGTNQTIYTHKLIHKRSTYSYCSVQYLFYIKN